MTLDDWAALAEQHAAWARRAAWTLLALGVLAFLVRGADRPADPYFATAADRAPLAGFGEIAFEVRTADGEVLDWCALLAATEQARQQGLMGQQDLLGYDGMVFRFDTPTEGSFWMYRTLIPLTVAFFDDTGAFVSAVDMEPCPSEDSSQCPRYPAERAFTHALEVERGGLGRLGVGDGATVAFREGECR